MRLRRDACWWLVAAMVFAGTERSRAQVEAGASSAATVPAIETQTAAPTLDTPPDVERPAAADIARALEIVKADPNLATERTVKSLRWRDSGPRTPSPRPAWMLWIDGLFRWLSESARLLMWCTIAGLAGLLIVFITRLARGTQLPQREMSFVAPTHVRDLDIRPETLPRDIGAAARALWDRGEHRAALALLYRGLLSRLAHVHRIPIRDSTTEGDCLTLTAASQLATRRREYASQLVRVWQRAVYGRENVPAATVYALCHDFASALDHVAPREAAQ